MIKISTEEDAQQWNDLSTELGKPASGFVRYAAAMYFHRRGMIGDATLEVYRVCSKLDHEDPHQALQKLDLGEDVRFSPIRRNAS